MVLGGAMTHPEDGATERDASYKTFFSGLTQKPEPYAYQRRMATHLCSSARDVLLTAPTGCGKTWATLGPFLYARSIGRPFADRVLYVLPLRALASSLKKEMEEAIRDLGLQVSVTIQTGDQSDDELFDRGDIIFTTIDQLLSSYLHIPVSLPKRLANLNAGALVGALIVFDEAHLLEPERALRTLLHLMDSHAGLARFVVATATFSSPAKRSLLASFRGRMIEEGPRQEEEVGAIPVLAQKRRAWTRKEGPLSATAVRALHRGGRTLVVVNTVRKAQEIGQSLLKDPPEGAHILVLHSRFFPHDRAAIEEHLTPLYGPKAGAANVILVATQVVEAGLDLSADLLLTELAPVNALVQRAGRCARYAAPRHEGEVVVFDLEQDSRGQRRLGPYRRTDSARCLELTWDALAGRERAILGHTGELALLETALAEVEGAMFAETQKQKAKRRVDERVRDAWGMGDVTTLRELVRDVRAVSVFLADEPEKEIDLAHGPVALSIPLPTWQGFLSDLEKQGRLGHIRRLVDDPVDESPVSQRWTWKSMGDRYALADAFCLSSSIASYRAMLGLQLEAAQERLPEVQHRGWAVGPSLYYARETYKEHVKRVLVHTRQWLDRNRVAIDCCAQRFRTSQDIVRASVLLAAGLHDTAKLDVRWQSAVHAWQTYKAKHDGEKMPISGEWLAHTDFNPMTDREAQRRPEFRRPNHAVEGALAVYALVEGWLVDLGCMDVPVVEGLCRCILSAIAHHHSPRATTFGLFELVTDAQEQILGPLVAPDGGGLCLPSAPALVTHPNADDRMEFEGSAFLRSDDPEDVDFWPLYSFLVRGLRLSDQAATREGATLARDDHEPREAM